MFRHYDEQRLSKYTLSIGVLRLDTALVSHVLRALAFDTRGRRSMYRNLILTRQGSVVPPDLTPSGSQIRI